METRQLTSQQLEAYARRLRLDEKSEATVEKYLRDLRAFLCWLDGRAISKELTSGWKTHLTELGYAPSSVNAMLSALNGMLEFLQLRDCRVRFLKIQRRIFRDADRELTKDDYQRLLAAARGQKWERLHLLVETIGSTGIRVSESPLYHRGSRAAGQGGNFPQRENPRDSAAGKALPQFASLCSKTKNRLRRDFSHRKRKGA